MPAPSRPAGPAAAAAVPLQRGLRARDVADLTHAAGFPSISVLLPTEPAPRLTTADAERLDELLREVRRRLAAEGVPATERLMARLRDQADRLRSQPTDRGLALYVNLAVSRAFRLTRPVLPRAVVEQTFATRDLVQELHRTPPYVVLVLDAMAARLYQVTGGAVRVVGAREMFREPADPGDPDLQAGFLLDVDRMLGGYRARHPSPLVLAGVPELLDRFVSTSRHLHRLAGRVPPEESGTAGALCAGAGRLLESYLRSRRQEALAGLERALVERPGDVSTGMAACWSAVHQARPEMLLVEQGYVSPEGPTPEKAWLRSHDLVDDLMELVILRGGQLALVADGDLGQHGRVALVSRSTAPRGR